MINYKELVDMLKKQLNDYNFSIHVYPWWSNEHKIDVPTCYRDEYVISNRYLEIRDDTTGESIAWINRYKPVNGGTIMYNPDEVWFKTRPYRLLRLGRIYRRA